MKRIIMAGALAAAILPLMAVGAGAATSLPPGPAIYPGNGGALMHVTASTPAEIHTPWGVITDEYHTGATIPAQYGGTQNGKPIPYPGWTASAAPSGAQLNWAVLTTPTGKEELVQNLRGIPGVPKYWATDGDAEYPTCMLFGLPAEPGSPTDWMVWTGSSWTEAPDCVLPG